MSSDAKDVKVILKEMREAIKNEKFAVAIEKGTALLKDEPENYMCNLLLGAAYQNVNKIEAARYLRKAVEYCAPTPPTVALQGLANCAPTQELPKIYEQLIKLLPDKRLDYYEKLFQIADNRNLNEVCFNILRNELVTATAASDEKLKLPLYLYLSKFWLCYDFPVSPNDEDLFQASLETIIDNSEQVDMNLLLNAYKRYLKLLYKQNNFEHCLKYAVEAVKHFPADVYAYEWICKIYCEHYQLEKEHFKAILDVSIQEISSRLLEVNANSGLAILVQAYELYDHSQYAAAHDLLKKVQNVQPNYGVAMELLARVEMKMDAFEMALPLWRHLKKTSTLEYAICLSHCSEERQLLEAVAVLEKISNNNDNVALNALANCYHKLQQSEKIKSLNLDSLSQAEFLMTTDEAIEKLEKIDVKDDFDILLLLGKLYMKQEKYVQALNCMLKATRLQPYRACCFYNLGRIYYATGDIVRARKCLEKCINMNPACIEAVYNLSAIYQELQEEDSNVALLLNALENIKVESSHKIQYKLGLHYLKANKCDDAIHAFRAAIKADVACIIFWESLGDAYAARGSYHSAIRVFQKTLEMDEDNVYAKLQLALLKTTLRMYSEAIEAFDHLLQTHPNYLPGLKGAAEAHLGLAQNLKLDHLYGRCKVHMQLALDQLQLAFLKQPNHNFVWLWRLTASIFMEVALFPRSMAHLKVSGKLAHADEDFVTLGREELLQLAKRFYAYAVKLKPNTFLWYELALCYYRCAEMMPDKALEQLELAEKACKLAIELQNERWQNWNLLGVIQMHGLVDNPELAQHCFIQALSIERKSYTSWTNLGVLYLRLKEIKLANQAFKRAQQSSPIYGNAWIGQAMIAEAIAEEEEALDLFRHCLQFKYHPESSLGYAHWICKELSNGGGNSITKQYKHTIEKNCADVVALDEINWYTINEEEQSTVSGLSFQAFLSIRQKLYPAAKKAYLQAVSKATPGAERDKMLTNLGYLLLKLNEPQQAIFIFDKLTESTLKSIFGLALAYFHNKQYQESYAVLSTILESFGGTDDHNAACTLLTMSSMLYASQGEADTKSILEQCLPLKGAPIQAIYSAFALGILHQDEALTSRMLQALKNQENCEEYCADIAYLIAEYHLRNGRALAGLKYIASRVHLFPHCTALRRLLANYLSENFDKVARYAVPTSQIALSAIDLSHRNMKTKNDCVEDAKCLIIASRALKLVNKALSSKLIQRAVHLNPQNFNAWSNLIVN